MNDTTDWFTIERIAPETHQITEGQGVLPCNTFVVDGGDEALLIDTGLGIGDLRSVVEDLVGGDVRVLLTHSHWDHLGAATQFDDVVINGRERGPDGTVSLDVLEDDYDQRPREFMADWLELGKPLPDGFDPDNYSIEPIPDVGAVDPGDTLTVGNRELELVPVPGHTPGLLAVLDRETGVCHGSDVLEPGIEIFAHFEDSNLSAYRESIDRLVSLRDEGAFDTLTIGHGDPIRDDDLSVLDHVSEALTAVANDEASYEVIETSWGPTRSATVGDVTVLTPAE
ncbi:MBL fold metallo-hydrolase [Natronosalvus halobius]|uniref:MBL fold metallo-hydrolase n=1 Tax=Natronosalvus halobius TaxID=2953746 RepID=UPI00209E9DA5|nr:MBL fold metallo-hydrolase [Natronosalvus halobius]USZ73585.1 MBL fold metallo-hydrolase [Natronosalvus halobius]